MNSRTHPEASLSPAEALRLEQACNRFEAAWRAGGRPRIEDFLADRAGPERSTLLRELVLLDVDYRRDLGEGCLPADYAERFPELDLTWLVREVGSSPAPTTAPGTADQPGGHVLLAALGAGPDAGTRYTLTRLHATGGIGRVWLARDQHLGREIALKELRPETAHDPTVWARFLEEARITGRLEHPGIVPVYELGGRGKDPDPFYTMRFVRGRTLAEAVRGYHHRRQAEQAGPLELRELLGALVAACNAVAYAHSRGVVHRDLKPQNVVLGDYGEVIVLDWGMAKVVDAPDATEPAAARLAAPAPAEPSDTQPGQVLGTPAYMAPEQAAGRPDLVDFRTDVYGLGAILYEILTGAPPFSGPDTREVLRRVCDEEPVRPRRGTIPAALEAVCRKAMAKAPAERYPSARRLAQDLEHWLADEPVSAYVEPWAGRTGRWLRRHRTLVRAGSAALVLTAVTFAVATVLLVAANERVRRARDDAVRSEREATRQRDLARQAVDTFYTQVSDSPELRARGAERLRTRLLETALRFYEEMLRETPGGTAVRQDQARAQRRVGDLYFALGRHPEAGAAYEAAQRLFGILAEDQPDTAGNREAQAACLLSLGNLHKETGARDRAEQSYRAGEDLLRRLSEADPDNVMYRSNLAAARGRLGMLYLDGGRYGPAETAFREGLAAFERALEQGPARTDALGNVARAHEALGFVYLRTGRDAQAEESLTRAGGLYEKLVALDPAEQHALAENRLSLSKFYLDKGKPDRAERPVRRALELFEALAAAHPDVPGYQADVARAANNLATMYYLRQEMEPAAQEFARALDIHRKLARSHPLVPAYRRDLARHANNLAVLYLNKGKFEDAERLAREALTAREQLVAAEPTVAVYRDELASGYVNLANLYKSRQRAEAAERAFRDAVAQYEKLTSTNQPAPAYRAGLAQTLHDLGILLSESGRRAEAQQLYSRAVSIQQCLVHDHADVTAYAVALGGTCCDLGNLLGDGDDPAAALPWYDQAVAALDRVRTREPGNAMARTFLRNSWWGRADTLGKLDRHRDALAAWDRVLELTPDTAGDRTSCRAARAVTLAHLGDHVRASKEAEQLARLPGLDGSEWYSLATAYALSAAGLPPSAAVLREQYNAATLGALARARVAGYFKDATNRDVLRTDEDLNAVRSDPRFRKLLAEVEGETGAAPAAKPVPLAPNRPKGD